MKEGLQSHLASLGGTNKKLDPKELVELVDAFTGKDLRDPDKYRIWKETREKNHQPIPPGNMVGQAGHHWLHHQPHLSGSGDFGDLVVAQWSPTELRWYHSNDLATTAKPLYGDGLMSHWKWITYIPIPEL